MSYKRAAPDGGSERTALCRRRGGESAKAVCSAALGADGCNGRAAVLAARLLHAFTARCACSRGCCLCAQLPVGQDCGQTCKGRGGGLCSRENIVQRAAGKPSPAALLRPAAAQLLGRCLPAALGAHAGVRPAHAAGGGAMCRREHYSADASRARAAPERSAPSQVPPLGAQSTLCAATPACAAPQRRSSRSGFDAGRQGACKGVSGGLRSQTRT